MPSITNNGCCVCDDVDSLKSVYPLLQFFPSTSVSFLGGAAFGGGPLCCGVESVPATSCSKLASVLWADEADVC